MKVKTRRDEDLTIITIYCIECEESFELVVKTTDWHRFEIKKELIQDCFPYLTVEDRELLLSGICGKCWTKIFKEGKE